MFQPNQEYVKLLKGIKDLSYIHKEYCHNGKTLYSIMGVLPTSMALCIQQQAFDCGDVIHITPCASAESIFCNGDKMLLN